MNCKASFNNKTGGDAGDRWREGKPIRVVRSYKGKKHSQYAPDEGNRYDGKNFSSLSRFPETTKTSKISSKKAFFPKNPFLS